MSVFRKKPGGVPPSARVRVLSRTLAHAFTTKVRQCSRFLGGISHAPRHSMNLSSTTHFGKEKTGYHLFLGTTVKLQHYALLKRELHGLKAEMNFQSY